MVPWKDKEAAIRALEQNGRVDPNDLIEAAQVETHPCHEDFTWDVEAAAKERWHDQARKLIRACKFEVIVEDVGQVVAPYYVPSTEDEDTTFRALPKVRSKTHVAATLIAEVAQLCGVASRAYGIALAKQRMIDDSIVPQLAGIRNAAIAVKEQLSGE